MTIGWGDVNHTRDAGLVNTERQSITINGEHIAKWMEDPDGRFEVVAPPQDDSPSALGRFYPSL